MWVKALSPPEQQILTQTPYTHRFPPPNDDDWDATLLLANFPILPSSSIIVVHWESKPPEAITPQGDF